MATKKDKRMATGAVGGAASGAAAGSAVAPGWGTLIGGVLGALGGAYTAYQAGEIDEAQLARLQEIAETAQRDFKLPSGQAKPITVEEYRLLGQYVPEVAKLLEERAPQLIVEADSQTEKRMQREALQRYADMSRTGDDAISRAAQEQAISQADAAVESRRQSTLRDMANRGLAGSGAGILSELSAGQDAQAAARQASLDAAAQAQQRRIQALQQMGSLAGDVRGQNRQTEQANVEIMNAFNQRMSEARNLQKQREAAARNEAQRYNMEAAQGIANANVGLRNQTSALNIDRQDRAAENLRNAQNELLKTRLGYMGGISDQQGKAAQNDVNLMTGAMGAGVAAAQNYGNASRDDARWKAEAGERQKDRDAWERVYGGSKAPVPEKPAPVQEVEPVPEQPLPPSTGSKTPFNETNRNRPDMRRMS